MSDEKPCVLCRVRCCPEHMDIEDIARAQTVSDSGHLNAHYTRKLLERLDAIKAERDGLRTTAPHPAGDANLWRCKCGANEVDLSRAQAVEIRCVECCMPALCGHPTRVGPCDGAAGHEGRHWNEDDGPRRTPAAPPAPAVEAGQAEYSRGRADERAEIIAMIAGYYSSRTLTDDGCALVNNIVGLINRRDTQPSGDEPRGGEG